MTATSPPEAQSSLTTRIRRGVSTACLVICLLVGVWQLVLLWLVREAHRRTTECLAGLPEGAPPADLAACDTSRLDAFLKVFGGDLVTFLWFTVINLAVLALWCFGAYLRSSIFETTFMLREKTGWDHLPLVFWLSATMGLMSLQLLGLPTLWRILVAD